MCVQGSAVQFLGSLQRILEDHMWATRILCRALVFPTITTIVGKTHVQRRQLKPAEDLVGPNTLTLSTSMIKIVLHMALMSRIKPWYLSHLQFSKSITVLLFQLNTVR